VVEHRHDLPVAMMCRLLEIKPTGFYAWLRRGESHRSKEDRRYKKKIVEIHAESDGVYGSRKVRDELLDLGFPAGRHLIARLMRELGLKGCPKRRYRVTTQSNHRFRIAPNRLDREFSAEAPNQRWVADITYIRTQEGWLYLAAVMDLYSMAIVGWSMSDRLNREIVVKALMMAIWQRKPAESLLHHSDRGSQYASTDFQDLLAEHGIECSMSGAGSCYDNAAMEGWFGMLKRERVNKRSYRTRAEARQDVFDYIERFYNRRRPHGSAGRMSPLEYEKVTLNGTVH
jgi:transposase InsO family protein